jgi:hypothetical protein
MDKSDYAKRTQFTVYITYNPNQLGSPRGFNTWVCRQNVCCPGRSLLPMLLTVSAPPPTSSSVHFSPRLTNPIALPSPQKTVLEFHHKGLDHRWHLAACKWFFILQVPVPCCLLGLSILISLFSGCGLWPQCKKCKLQICIL